MSSAGHVENVTDDAGGRRLADDARRLLRRLSAQGATVGTIQCLTTVDVLRVAIRKGGSPNMGELKAIYASVSTLDDGLVSSFEETVLPGEFTARRTRDTGR